MRIEQIEIEGFGPLRDRSYEALEDHDVIVVHGPNEAGKSALREFITTMLYGFDPASRDAHPSAPAFGDLAFAGSLTVRHGDELVRITRQLKSKPGGTLTRGDAKEKLDNRPAPQVEPLSRQTFRALHSLDLDELGRIDAGTWQAVEQRLLGGAAAAFLRPAHEAVRLVDERAAGLWRDDKRGNPRATRLAARHRELRGERRVAAQAAEQLALAVDELAATRARLAEGRAKATEHERVRRRHERFAPVLRAQHEIERLRREADELVPIELCEQAGDDAASRIAQLREDLAMAIEECEQLDRELAIERGQAEECDRDRLLLGHAGTLHGLSALVERDRDDRRRLELETERATERAVAADDVAQRTLGRTLRGEDEPALGSVDSAALRAAIVRCERAAAAFVGESARPVNAAHPWIAFAGAAVAVAVALATSAVVLRTGGIALGVLLLVLGWSLARGRDRAQRVRLAVGEHTGARGDLAIALGDLAISPARFTEPDASLASDVEQLRVAVREARLARDARTHLERTIADRESERASVRVDLGSSDVVALAAELELAQSRRLRREQAIARLDEIELRRVARATTQSRIATRLGALGATVRAASPTGDEADGLRRLRDARAKRIAADERDLAMPAAVRDEARALIAERALVELSDDELVELVDELEALQRENERLAAAEGDLQARCQQLAEQQGVADIDGEIGAIEQELVELRRERDRLALLSMIISAGEREVRDRYAPAFVQAASAYLAAITAGRYHSLALAEAAGGEPRLEVLCGDSPYPIPVGHPLSRGTIEQIYVSLRLALVDEVDSDARLPLFLDEVLVNWDPRRIDAIVALLGALDRRQVFISTCHPELADVLEQRLRARVLDLPGPDGALLERATTTRRRAIALVKPPGVLPAAEAGPTLLDMLDA